MGDVKKVAVLGGGVGAMTAAYWLQHQAELNPGGTQYDITVYQLGWRLGGKGASGRNMTPGFGARIEEHGLHMWMGFYANAFRTMEKVYEELGRPANAPLATWQDAFKPHNFLINESSTLLAWYPWLSHFPPNKGTPGQISAFRTACGYLVDLAAEIKKTVGKITVELQDIREHPVEGIVDIVEITAIAAALAVELEELHLAAQASQMDESHRHEALHDRAKSSHELIAQLIASIPVIDSINRWLYLADLGIAFIRGIIKDDICTKGWSSIDDLEWRTWLLRNGMHQQTAWMPYIRAVYDMIFAFHDGIANEAHADVSAGWASVGALRMFFDYQGALFWKMQAGMGDTVFGPFYEVLKRKGVKFRFFNRVRELIPTADGTGIASIRVGVQATVKDGREYEPLVDVKGLPCWPATPLYEQLVQGDLLKAGNIDLESYSAAWPDIDDIVLQAGVDFDWVVFGLSLGAVPYVCPKLVEQKPAWQKMVEKVGVVRTQSCQFWLNRNVKELGWPPAVDGTDNGERALLGSFVEPLDTWADMSQLIDREDWPAKDNVQNIAYMCGPATKDANIYKQALDLLRFDYHWLWQAAYDEIGEFKWDWLVDPYDRKGVQRFLGQFFRLNHEPTELYVLSYSNTTQHRLGHDTGYANLCLAGDWNRSPFPLGCVEGAVIGGMFGIEPITGPLPIVR